MDPVRLETIASEAFGSSPDNPLAVTQALLVSHHGEIVLERYGPEFDSSSRFISWSMAKSVLSALCGVVIGDGLFSLQTPLQAIEWQQRDDARSEITVRNLLEMRSGLSWNEDYLDAGVSDVIEMLFGSGKADVASHAATMPLEYKPGEVWKYSSGTSNIISRFVSEAIGGGPAGFEATLVDGLLRPAGMRDVSLTFDEAGTWVGSSFLHATARDFLAFGELFRNDGVIDGKRLIPEGWVAASTAEQAVDPETGQGYGLHWWTVRDAPSSYAASGYEGQRIQVTPDLGMTFVRLGKTPAERGEELRSFYADIVACFV